MCILRLAQGLGLGGEWGGAALLATENAPKNKRALFGMFPQLGPSIGFLLSNGVFLCVTLSLSNEQFLDGVFLLFLVRFLWLLVCMCD